MQVQSVDNIPVSMQGDFHETIAMFTDAAEAEELEGWLEKHKSDAGIEKITKSVASGPNSSASGALLLVRG